MDHLQALKTHCVTSIEQHQQLHILAPSVYLNVLFQYQPVGVTDQAELRRINIAICKAMQEAGSTFSDYAQYQGRTGIRLIIANEAISNKQLDALLIEICALGNTLTDGVRPQV